MWSTHRYVFSPKFEWGISLNKFFQIQTVIKSQLSLETNGLPNEEHYLLPEIWNVICDKTVAERQDCLHTICLYQNNQDTQSPPNTSQQPQILPKLPVGLGTSFKKALLQYTKTKL